MYWPAIMEKLYWLIQPMSVWCIQMMKTALIASLVVEVMDWREKIGFEQGFSQAFVVAYGSPRPAMPHRKSGLRCLRKATEFFG